MIGSTQAITNNTVFCKTSKTCQRAPSGCKCSNDYKFVIAWSIRNTNFDCVKMTSNQIRFTMHKRDIE